MMDPRDKVFVTASALGRALAGPAPPTVLAIRNLDAAAIAGFAASERIAGAVDVSMPGEMAGPGGGTAGSRPLPAIADLQRDARRWGLRQGAAVVVYDHDRCLTAARAWWVLRWAGIADVRLLDGGLTAWQAAGLPIARQSPTPTPGDVTLTAGHMKVLDANRAAAFPGEGVLLDSRVRVNYIGGAVAPGQPRRGHIPGSISAPAHDALMEAGGFADAATLRHLYGALGADGGRAVGVTCGAGVSAAHTVAALASIGIDAAMFPGSWSAWSADPARPAVIGALPT